MTTAQITDATDTAVEFLQMAASGRAGEAMERFAAADFVHHNPWFAADADSLATAMDENARANPEKSLVVQRTITEGDLVAVHSAVRHAPGGSLAATVHVFRFAAGRIAELWDVAQEEPPDSPNQRGMF